MFCNIFADIPNTSCFISTPMNLLKANPNEPISRYVTAEQIKANPEVLGGGKTVGQVIQWANKTINKGGGNTSTAKAANVAVGPGIS